MTGLRAFLQHLSSDEPAVLPRRPSATSDETSCHVVSPALPFSLSLSCFVFSQLLCLFLIPSLYISHCMWVFFHFTVTVDDTFLSFLFFSFLSLFLSFFLSFNILWSLHWWREGQVSGLASCALCSLNASLVTTQQCMKEAARVQLLHLGHWPFSPNRALSFSLTQTRWGPAQNAYCKLRLSSCS